MLGAVAVKLDDVDPDAAAAYLECVQRDPPPDQWRELIDRLRSTPDSPLARALSNPLTLTLVRDTYRDGDSVRDLLVLGDTTGAISREAVRDHLLKRVLPQAYRERPGRPSRYSLATAQHTLQLIASLMRQDSQDPRKPGRDLAWWRIPTWTAAFPRALIIGAASGLAIWLGWGLDLAISITTGLPQWYYLKSGNSAPQSEAPDIVWGSNIGRVSSYRHHIAAPTGRSSAQLLNGENFNGADSRDVTY